MKIKVYQINPELDRHGGGAGQQDILHMGQNRVEGCDDGPVGDFADSVVHGGSPFEVMDVKLRFVK